MTKRFAMLIIRVIFQSIILGFLSVWVSAALSFTSSIFKNVPYNFNNDILIVLGVIGPQMIFFWVLLTCFMFLFVKQEAEELHFILKQHYRSDLDRELDELYDEICND